MISMDESIDGYWAELIATVRRTAEARSRDVRTTDETVIRFEQTQRDRLWQMKVDKRLVDSVLVCPEDGHRELVHMDMILGLDRDMVPFYEKSPNQSDDNLDQYNVDRTISSPQLKSIVFFAYNRGCELTEQLALSLGEIADEFGIYSLLDFCLTYLRDHFHVGIAVQYLELALDSSPDLEQYFHNYVCDHFDQLWLKHQSDFMGLTYDTLVQLLTSDWLNVDSETTPWQVIQAWIGHDPKSRVPRLASLIKDALRFGRMPSSFNIQQSIVSCNLFQYQPIEVRQKLSEFISEVLEEAIRAPKPIDGNCLPFDESVYHFRPRNPSQLLILAGGKDPRTGIPSEYKDTIQVYDFQLNLWRSSRVSLPEKMIWHAMQSIGTTMYVIVGQKHDYTYNGVYSMDLAQAEPKWVALPCMRILRRQVTFVVYKGKLVVIGGPCCFFRTECEQYDPITRVWTQFARLNRARGVPAAIVHNERIYVAGGGIAESVSVEMYDPESDHWQLVAPMNIWRRSFSLVNYLDQILVIGGYSFGDNTIESYNPTTNLWTVESSVHMVPSLTSGAHLNGELLLTDLHGGLYTIQNLGPSARLVQLGPCEQRIFYSLTVVPSRLAVAFHKP